MCSSDLLKSQSLAGGDSLIAAFAKFSAAHPGFVIYSQLDAVTVISVQSPFMRSQMVKERLLDGLLVSCPCHPKGIIGEVASMVVARL